MIKIEDLSKSFKNVIALSNVNLEIKDGEIFGIVGPNGSGKTTMLRTIIKEIDPDRGKIYSDDTIIKEGDKMDFAYMSEQRNGINNFRLNDYRNFYSMLYPKWDDSLFFALVSNFKIPDTRKYKNLSMGNKSALMFALTVSANTRYVLLDEPTQHLDPQRRYVALETIKKLSLKDKTIIISSHQMEEMEGVITSFAILLNSVLLYTDTLDNAKDYHRILGKTSNLHDFTMVATLSDDDMLVKVDNPEIDSGRYPKFGEIVVGYLKRGIQI